MQVTFTLFPDLSGATRQQYTAAFSELVAKCISPKEHASKSAMPLVKLATFGESRSAKGSLRHDANLVSCHGVEGDYDAGLIGIAEGAERLRAADIDAILYTTPSHTPAAPRWRVLAFFKTPRTVMERHELAGVLNAALGGILAKESFAGSQAFYFGKVAGTEYQAVHVAGCCIDDGADLFYEPVFPAGLEERTHAEPDDLARELTLAGVTDETMVDVRSAVRGLNARRAGSGSYPDWVAVLNALKSLETAGQGAEALALAHEFSAKGGAAYAPEKLEAKWRQLEPRSVTYKTLFKLAADDGWVNPRSAVAQPERVDGGRQDMTDAGNCNVLWDETRGDLRFINEGRQWMQWSGVAWIIDESGGRAQGSSLVVGEWWRKRAEAKEKEAESASGDDRKNLLKLAESFRSWSSRCRNKHGIDSMLSVASRDPRFAISASVLDRDRWALGVANGVVDLRSGQLRPGARDDFITKIAPFPFNPSAPAVRWSCLIEEVTGVPVDAIRFTPRPALAAYLRRLIGYAATGLVREHKMFVWVGAGSNGKSVLTDMLAHVLGPHCVQVPPDVLMAAARDSSGEAASPNLRRLAGARLAISSEAKEGQKLNAALVKRQTGDATMTARGLHQNPVTFEVTHKLALLTNHQPHMDHLDEATRTRLHLVPFDRRWNRPGITNRDPRLPDGDKTLMDKLKAESEGILAWIVAAAMEYAAHGLMPPEEVIAKTSEYFAEQDPLVQWLETMQQCTPKEGTAAAALFASFVSWAASADMKGGPGTQRAFSSALEAAGIERDRVSSGTVWGLRGLEGATF